MKRKNELLESKKHLIINNVVSLLIAFFLGYLTFIDTIEGTYIVSLFLMIIFTLIYYFIFVRKFFLAYEKIYKEIYHWISNVKLKNYLGYSLLVPSILLVGASIIILIFIKYYHILANKSFGMPEFGTYFVIAENIPAKMNIIILICTILFFILQPLIILKYEKVSKSKIFHLFGASFIFTAIMVLSMWLFVYIMKFIFNLLTVIF
ncbi:hypothetical protein J4434_08900 [Candidatus Woesearchaeota archaeon]|nr:hypothetical protein [Candidatus Woesearchaeota archaeon]